MEPGPAVAGATAEVEHDLVRAVESEGAHEFPVIVELPDRRGRDRFVGGGRHRVRPRVRREPHARAAHEIAQLCEALAKR